MHFIDYDDLTRRPQATMEAVYKFLGEDGFAHDFDNVEQVTVEDDFVYGFKDLHVIRQKVEPQPPQWPRSTTTRCSRARRGRTSRTWPSSGSCTCGPPRLERHGSKGAMTAADGVEGSPAADPPLSPTGRHAQAIGELMGDWGGVFALVRADLARLRLDEYQ